MQIPVPAHVHYEIALRLLERQTVVAVLQTDYAGLEDLQELIRTLRKALAQQKLLEERWERQGRQVDYRWSYDEQPSAP